MPRGDRTGPMGLGPMTGRAAGYCAGYGVPGYMNPAPGRGFGLGLGGGWGRGFRWRHWYYATGLPGWVRFGYGPAWGWGVPSVTQEQETEMLKAQAKALQDQLDAINKRLAELEKEG
ncbi:MAG: DUF5320 domain-containing protein [Anaerolineae bacterium]